MRSATIFSPRPAPPQREYQELLEIFFPDGVPARRGWVARRGTVVNVGIGLAGRIIEGRVHGADVYDAGPVAKAGIMRCAREWSAGGTTPATWARTATMS